MSENQAQGQENPANLNTDELDRLCNELTVDQMRFVVSRQEHSTDKAAAQAIGVNPATVSVWKRDGAPIDEAVKLMAFDGLIVAAHLRRRHLAKAMAVKVAGLDSDDERLRQGVATEVIEWEMGKPKQSMQTDVTSGGQPIKAYIGISPDDWD